MNNRFFNLMFLWSGFFLILWMTSRNQGPAKLTPDQQAAVAAAATPAGQLLAAKPVELANPQLKAKIDPDGGLVGAQVVQFNEEIVGEGFTPEDIAQHIAQQQQQNPQLPVYSAGVHVGHLPLYVSDARRLRLTASGEVKGDTATFDTADPNGVVLHKGLAVQRRWKIHDKGHRLDLDVVLKNTTKDVLDLSQGKAVYVYAGPLLCAEGSTPEAFFKQGDAMNTVSPSTSLTETTTGVNWMGVRNQYFAILLEHRDGPGVFVHQMVTFRDLKLKQRMGPVIGFKSTVPFLKAGEERKLSFRVYLGPKLEEALAPDYARVFNNWEGWTGGIGHLMFRVLNFFHAITGSWGIAILLLTLLVKVLLHPLTYKQTVNMQKMQEIQPKLQALKERYKDNPEQMQAETMRLWQEHNVNPVGGCLPMFLQIPVFIALYGCIQGAIDLKGVSFWWMQDLSKPDATTLLALLFSLSIYFNGKLMQQQQKAQASAQLTPGQDQDMQVVMNRMMPIMMYGMFVMMPVPAGVMIYLASQSLLGIAETRYNMDKMARRPGKRVKANA
jgi:YidC/Oxa1 family membrane protein insertase